jgi:hypothetical protein
MNETPAEFERRKLMKRAADKERDRGDLSASPCSPCPDCEDTGYVGDQEAGGMYVGKRKTTNSEWKPCGCDRRELAKRRIARANAKESGAT